MCLYYLYFCSSAVIVNLSMRQFLIRMVFLLSHKHGLRFLVIISPFQVQCHYGCVWPVAVFPCPWWPDASLWTQYQETSLVSSGISVYSANSMLSIYLPHEALYSRTNYGQILSVQRYHPSFGLEILFLQPTQISHILSKEKNTYATSLE